MLLTWYYGIGYEYYSIGADGYYSEAAAYDKFEKNTAQKWGAAVYIKNTATAFRAQNITFESSFNKYITDEELADEMCIRDRCGRCRKGSYRRNRL